MEQVLGGILVVAVVAGIIALAIHAHKMEKRRQAELAALAAECGFRFDPSRRAGGDWRHEPFSPFTSGHSRSRANTFEGSLDIDGRPFSLVMGDYQYKVTTSNGKTTSTTTYNFSYLILHLPFANLPTMAIRGENIFDKIAGAIGFDDIDFESAEFSRKFHVKSSDKRFAYDVVHPRMMEFLLGHRGYTIELQKGLLLVYRGVARWDPATFRQSLEYGRAFLDLWPDHLTRELSA